MTRRCRCWRLLGIALAVTFGVLEERGYRHRCAHRTLSRELESVLGRRGSWLFAAAGLTMTAHLLTLDPLEVPHPHLDVLA